MKKIALTGLTFVLALVAVRAQQYPGYTLYSANNGTTAYLIDTNSVTYHQWTFPTTAKSGYSCYLLPNQVLLRSVSKTGNYFTGGPICGQVQKVDWSGTVLWDFVYSTTNYCTHHDIYPMPNGNVLLIAYERKTATEVTAAGSTLGIEMWPDKIVEVQPTGTNTGTIVWEWHAWDHLVQNVDATKANYQTSISAHPELLNINYKTAKDWIHMNGLSYNAQLDQIAFSSHNLNEIYVIDHSTTTAEAASHSGGNSGKGGDLLYRWGNPAAYSAGTSANQVINVTHDAHWVPQGCPKAGYLVAFNNNGVSTSQSSVDLINPPVSGYNYTLTGTAYTPASYNWRHPANGYTSNMGGSQQLPNGNMIVTIALSGKIYEIDSNQNILWTKTGTGTIAKAFRYSACYVDGGPATPTITQSGNTLTASTGTTYQWYLNGNPISGATNQSYTATVSGAYTVKVTDGSGCVSEASLVQNVIVTSVNDFGSIEYGIYPNPTSGLINIKSDELTGKNYTVILADGLGKIIQTGANLKTMDLSAFSNGIYYISVKTSESVKNEKLVLIK
jgi:hypothetical protein